MRIVVYTALFGELQTQLYAPSLEGLTDVVDLVAFTDFGSDPTGTWKVESGPGCFAHPRMSAKWYRCNSDYLFPDHDIAIWVDASMRVTLAPLIAHAKALMHVAPIAMFPHPERNNIYDECAYSATMPKYDAMAMYAQVHAYRKAGLPDTAGLWATGVRISAGQNSQVAAFNRLWLNECVRWTYQDQLSAPYALWRLGIVPAIIPGNVFTVPWLERIWTGPDT